VDAESLARTARVSVACVLVVSEADPGSPAQLVMAPGSSTPMLVYVLDDGVHVYERTG
jgi:hypothetical protein